MSISVERTFSFSVLVYDNPPEYDVCDEYPGDGDGEAPVHWHVGQVPSAHQDAPHGLARERLRQEVRDVPAQKKIFYNVSKKVLLIGLVTLAMLAWTGLAR